MAESRLIRRGGRTGSQVKHEPDSSMQAPGSIHDAPKNKKYVSQEKENNIRAQHKSSNKKSLTSAQIKLLHFLAKEAKEAKGS